MSFAPIHIQITTIVPIAKILFEKKNTNAGNRSIGHWMKTLELATYFHAVWVETTAIKSHQPKGSFNQRNAIRAICHYWFVWQFSKNMPTTCAVGFRNKYRDRERNFHFKKFKNINCVFMHACPWFNKNQYRIRNFKFRHWAENCQLSWKASLNLSQVLRNVW